MFNTRLKRKVKPFLRGRGEMVNVRANPTYLFKKEIKQES